MAAANDDFERVARWLDGEDVELTAEQRALAEEVLADEAALAGALEVAPPPGVLHRVQAGLVRGPVRRPLRRRYLAVLSAAAAVVATVLALWLVGRSSMGPATPEYVEQFLEPPAAALDARVDALAEELADAQVRLALGDEWPVETAVAALAEELGELIADEGAAGTWELWEESL